MKTHDISRQIFSTKYFPLYFTASTKLRIYLDKGTKTVLTQFATERDHKTWHSAYQKHGKRFNFKQGTGWHIPPPGKEEYLIDHT